MIPTRWVIILALAILSGCTDPEHARELLKHQGYKNITITGYNFFSCAKDDFYHTGFAAVAPDNSYIRGTVCKGVFFKGATIRFD